MDTIPTLVPKIANNLRRLRDEKFWSHRELALRAGVSPTTVIHLEHGGEAQRRSVRKLAEALGVNPHDLLDEPDED